MSNNDTPSNILIETESILSYFKKHPIKSLFICTVLMFIGGFVRPWWDYVTEEYFASNNGINMELRYHSRLTPINNSNLIDRIIDSNRQGYELLRNSPETRNYYYNFYYLKLNLTVINEKNKPVSLMHFLSNKYSYDVDGTNYESWGKSQIFIVDNDGSVESEPVLYLNAKETRNIKIIAMNMIIPPTNILMAISDASRRVVTNNAQYQNIQNYNIYPPYIESEYLSKISVRSLHIEAVDNNKNVWKSNDIHGVRRDGNIMLYE